MGGGGSTPNWSMAMAWSSTARRCARSCGSRGCTACQEPGRPSGAGPTSRPPLTWSSAASTGQPPISYGSPTLNTEHPIREGKLYCCVVLDVFSRRVVGWSIDSHQATPLVTNALGMAITNRTPIPDQTVIHSDHGSQGGFSWSSQHLVDGGVDGDDARAAAGGAAVSGADSVAGSADGGLAAGSRPVLGGDCARCQFRGRGAGDRRVVRGRGAVVPARWRCEPLSCPDGVGAVSVLRRTRGHCHLARSQAGGARDRPAAEPVALNDLAGVAAQRVHADLAAGVSGVDRAVARPTPRSSA